MKYFTPELIERFGSSDPAIADEADAAWEEAGEKYELYLASNNPWIPEGIRKLYANYYLHDAVVYGMEQHDDRFVIKLRLDTPPRELLILTYELSGGPDLEPEALPREHRCFTQVEWMYDEAEVNKVDDKAVGITHSILFSNGWEVRLPLRSLQVQTIDDESLNPWLKAKNGKGPVFLGTWNDAERSMVTDTLGRRAKHCLCYHLQIVSTGEYGIQLLGPGNKRRLATGATIDEMLRNFWFQATPLPESA